MGQSRRYWLGALTGILLFGAVDMMTDRGRIDPFEYSFRSSFQINTVVALFCAVLSGGSGSHPKGCGRLVTALVASFIAGIPGVGWLTLVTSTPPAVAILTCSAASFLLGTWLVLIQERGFPLLLLLGLPAAMAGFVVLLNVLLAQHPHAQPADPLWWQGLVSGVSALVVTLLAALVKGILDRMGQER